jgi:hypothetical protein
MKENQNNESPSNSATGGKHGVYFHLEKPEGKKPVSNL